MYITSSDLHMNVKHPTAFILYFHGLRMTEEVFIGCKNVTLIIKHIFWVPYFLFFAQDQIIRCQT